MAEQTQILSHWLQHFEGLNQSSQAFYGLVQKAVETKKIPDVKFSRVDFKEGGIFSSSREYLRVQRGDLRYDIGGAPFGNGFFVSARAAGHPRAGDADLRRAPARAGRYPSPDRQHAGCAERAAALSAMEQRRRGDRAVAGAGRASAPVRVRIAARDREVMRRVMLAFREQSCEPEPANARDHTLI